LQALQVAPLNGIHGKSLFPILENTKKKHRDAVFSEYLVDNKAMIRTTKWKYVFNTGKADLGLGYATGNPPSGILHQLYDLENDPNETHNVAAQPANKKELLKLQKKMLDVFRETHHYAASIAASLSTDEQLAAFCEPPENRKK
jgi:arylsulfatase A-like enzyme